MTTIRDLDFGRMYREQLAAAGRLEKPPGEWDTRASEPSRETVGSPCVDQFDGRGMRNALVANATARGLSNVEPILRAWHEDWADVPACDLVVASRATLVEDLADPQRARLVAPLAAGP